MTRRISAAIAAIVMALAVSLGTASMAMAHSDTFQSVPATGSTVSTPVTELVFTFVEPVNVELSPPEVALVNAEGVVAELGAPVLDEVGSTMTVQVLTGALPNGDYTASYRIVSEDGHPASGQITFVVEGSDAPVLVAPVANEEEDAIVEADAEAMVTSSGANGNDTQLQVVLGLSAAGAVALAAVLVVVSLRRRRNSQAK